MLYVIKKNNSKIKTYTYNLEDFTKTKFKTCTENICTIKTGEGQDLLRHLVIKQCLLVLKYVEVKGCTILPHNILT